MQGGSGEDVCLASILRFGWTRFCMQAYQEFDSKSRSVINYGELLRKNLFVTATGSYMPQVSSLCLRLVNFMSFELRASSSELRHTTINGLVMASYDVLSGADKADACGN